MYSEEIKYAISYSKNKRNLNKIRISYFENRSWLTNVLDFLDQEVIIMPSNYFSCYEGLAHSMEDGYTYADTETDEIPDRWSLITESLYSIDADDGYNLCVLDNFITIVNKYSTCIFTNKYMGEEPTIIGTIVWVKNFNELLKKFGNRNLKRISKAIVCPFITNFVRGQEWEGLDPDFFLLMDIYKPEVVFKYTIDTYMSNVCIDVYNKLAKSGLNGLVDKYIPSYKQCDGYGEKGKEENYNEKICKCGGLRAFCYLDF